MLFSGAAGGMDAGVGAADAAGVPTALFAGRRKNITAAAKSATTINTAAISTPHRLRLGFAALIATGAGAVGSCSRTFLNFWGTAEFPASCV